MIPDGFQARRAGRRYIVALPQYLEPLAAAELEALPAAAHGRGTICRLATPDGNLLIRKCHRGGLLRLINRDRYLTPRRPIDELRLCREAAARGVPVCSAAGAIVERRAPFWLCWLATEEIEEAIDVGEYLRSLPAAPTPEAAAEKRRIIDAAGRAICTMHDAGLYHADLQAKNILVRRGSSIELFFIDLDKSRICPAGLAEPMRADNLRRLNRSVMKTQPNAIDDLERQRFLAAYRCGNALFGDTAAFITSCKRHAARHSLWWRLFR